MDKQFFMNSSIPHQLPYDHPFSSTMPTWESLSTAMEIQTTQSSNHFLSTPPHIDHFDSTLTSMVSSPTSNSAISNDNFVIRELIGKLGNICNSNSIPNYINGGNCSTNNSCHNTPLHSPPKLGKSMPIIDHMVEENFPSLGNSIGLSSNLPELPSDPGFAERAARFSSFGSKSFNGRTTSNQIGLNNADKNGDFVHRLCSNLGGGNGKLQRVSSSPLLKIEARSQVENNTNNCMNERKQLENSVNDQHVQQTEFSNSLENSSISNQNQAKENGSSRKRKAVTSNGKEKKIGCYSQMPTNSNIVTENGDDSNAKRSRLEECNGKEGGESKEEENKGEDDGKKQNQNNSEPFKDYIHVRARRGQATDSHSLAERVRREKIGERMKLLQDLVPGCNKVTGKALMLEEIINYVQSLQRQVEFLSMKLSNVNPRLDMNMCNLFSKDAIEPNCSMQHPMYPTMVPTLYGQPQQNASQDSSTTSGTTAPFSMDPFNPPLNHNHSLHLPLIDGFSNYLSQLPSLCEGDLQSIVQMGFGQKENGFQAQTLHGPHTTQMKIEF